MTKQERQKLREMARLNRELKEIRSAIFKVVSNPDTKWIFVKGAMKEVARYLTGAK